MRISYTYGYKPPATRPDRKRNGEDRSLAGMQFHDIGTISHQHARKTALRVMHGLEWRVPLLIELDEFHRSCVIDPDLPTNKSACRREMVYQNGPGEDQGREQKLTNAPKLPL